MKSRNPLLFSVVFVFSLLSFSSHAQEAEKWFTLDVGDEWTFEDTRGKMTIRILEETELEKVTALKVGWFTAEKPDDPYQVEYWLQDGTEYKVAARGFGDRLLAFDEPYVFIKSTMKPGNTWTSAIKLMGREMKLEFTVGEKETIKTSEGEVEAIKVTIKGPPQTVDRWYAPAIGMVQERTRLTLGGKTSSGNTKTLVARVEG